MVGQGSKWVRVVMEEKVEEEGERKWWRGREVMVRGANYSGKEGVKVVKWCDLGCGLVVCELD